MEDSSDSPAISADIIAGFVATIVISYIAFERAQNLSSLNPALLAISAGVVTAIAAASISFARRLKNEQKKNTVLKSIGGFIGAFIVLLMLGAFGQKEATGYGEINLFDSLNGSKNYRVSADITEHRGFLWSKTYQVDSFTYPDGSEGWLDNCRMKRHEKVFCTDWYDLSWGVEIDNFRIDEI